MNYYEQFYDDLEVYDPAEEEMLHREPPPLPPPPYWEEEEDYMTHRDQPYPFRGPGHGQFHRGRGNWHGRGDRGQGHWDRGRGSWNRGRGRAGMMASDSPGRGRGFSDAPGRGRGFSDPPSRGRGFSDSPARGRGFSDPPSRGRGFSNSPGRGRGISSHNARGVKMNFVNFVKAGEENISENTSNALSTVEQLVGKEIQAIRNDCQAQQGKPDASAVFTSPVLPAYGYGDGSDFKDFGTSSFNSEPSVPSISDPQPDPQQDTCAPGTEPPVVRKPMTIPALNFVKAKSEFKSTDVAFHEIEKPMPEQQQSVKKGFSAGNKRAGLGMGMCVGGEEALAAFQKHKTKDGSNPQFDARFAKLRDGIKQCNNGSRNAIEMFHVATSKCKMKINDETRTGNRSDGGQILFSHILDVDGVVLGRGETTNKKAAKHEAFNSALKLLLDSECTVRETNGVLELKPAQQLLSIANSTRETSAAGGRQNEHAVSQGQHIAERNAASTSVNASRQSHVNMPGYVKPKIVFHQSSTSAAQPTYSKQTDFSPSELANKLVQSVKEDEAKRDRFVGGRLPNGGGNQQWSNQVQADRPGTSQQKPPPGLKRNYGQERNNPNKKKRRRNAGPTFNDISDFVIYDHSVLDPSLSNAICILHSSANYNNVVLKVEYELDQSRLSDEKWSCSVLLGEHLVANGQGCSREEAKQVAAKEALVVLRENCYSIVVKQTVDSDESGLTKEELLGNMQKTNDAIPDSNIGNMLLRKMGWVEGGIGKDGKGIAEPVKAEMVIRREGLGLSKQQGTGGDFREKVYTMLSNYIKSDNQNDLYFSSELTKEERAAIHQVAERLKLKSQSRGKGEGRYLIISRKRNIAELLDHVMSCGGSTSKYEIIPPSSTDASPFHKELSSPFRKESLTYGHDKQ